MKKHLKKIIIGLIIVALSITGIVFLMNQQSNTEVNVYPTMMFSMTEDWTQQQTMSGNVITDKLQPVYVSNTQTITDILVVEGQEVKKGDILLTYDSTLSELSLVRKDLEIQKTQLEIDKAYKELEVINSYQPGVPVIIASKLNSMYRLGIDDVTEPVYETIVFNLVYENLNTENLQAPKVKLFKITNESDAPAVEVNDVEIIVEKTDTGYTFTINNLVVQEPGASYTYHLYQLNDNDEVLNNEDQYVTSNQQEAVVRYNEKTITNSLLVVEQPPKYPNLVSGSGTQEDPYIFIFNDKMSINSAFMDELLVESSPIFATFNVYLEDNPKNEILQSFSMRFDKLPDNQGNVFTFLALNNDPNQPPTDDPNQPGDDPGFIDDIPVDPGPPTITYTANELFKMRTEKEAQIRNLLTTKKTAEVEYKNLEFEKNNNFVLSELDGIVSEVIDPETAKNENKQLFQVSSSGSFIVETFITELDLSSVKVGDLMSVFSYDTGAFVEGTIDSISPYPSANQMYFGGPQQNQSSYPIRILVDKSADLKPGMWVEVRKAVNQENPQQFFAIMNAFVRTDQGQPYVWMAQDGKLIKKEVSIGRTIQGSYIEILNGDITMDDMLAFPYGKSLKEGNPVKEAGYEDLYNPIGGN